MEMLTKKAELQKKYLYENEDEEMDEEERKKKCVIF